MARSDEMLQDRWFTPHIRELQVVPDRFPDRAAWCAVVQHNLMCEYFYFYHGASTGTVTLRFKNKDDSCADAFWFDTVNLDGHVVGEAEAVSLKWHMLVLSANGADRARLLVTRATYWCDTCGKDYDRSCKTMKHLRKGPIAVRLLSSRDAELFALAERGMAFHFDDLGFMGTFVAERDALECIEGREGKDDAVLASIVDPSRTLPGAWAALPAGWNGAGAAAAGAPPANESQAAAVRALALALEKVRWLAFQAHHLSQPHRLWTLS